jgi:hypothetical protein
MKLFHFKFAEASSLFYKLFVRIMFLDFVHYLTIPKRKTMFWKLDLFLSLVKMMGAPTTLGQ